MAPVVTTLIRSRTMLSRSLDRHTWEQVEEGAVLQEDGTITEVGIFADLQRRYPTVDVIGSGNEILLPGFVNAHHHVGLTPVQLGSPDMPLELLVRHEDGRAHSGSAPRYALFGVRDGCFRNHNRATYPRPSARWGERGRGRSGPGDPCLPGHRHARFLLLRHAGSEPDRLPGRHLCSSQVSSRTNYGRRRGAGWTAFSFLARVTRTYSKRPGRQTPREPSCPHPAISGKSSLVLGRGPQDVRRSTPSARHDAPMHICISSKPL